MKVYFIVKKCKVVALCLFLRCWHFEFRVSIWLIELRPAAFVFWSTGMLKWNALNLFAPFFSFENLTIDALIFFFLLLWFMLSE